MSGKVFFALLLFPVLFSFKDFESGPPVWKALLRQYAEADHLYNLDGATPQTNRAALDGFLQVTAQAAAFERAAGTDSI
ncbi:MAG: hypothetical protein ABUL46_03165, partial [Chitinophaga rupis]